MSIINQINFELTMPTYACRVQNLQSRNQPFNTNLPIFFTTSHDQRLFFVRSPRRRRPWISSEMCSANLRLESENLMRCLQQRYTKKPRQVLVSSSLDSLGLSKAVAHAFVCKRMVWWIHGGGGGEGGVYYIVDMQWSAKLQLLCY